MIYHSRITYALLAIGTVLLGLFSRTSVLEHYHFIVMYVGDSLWALLVYWLVRFLLPNKSYWLCAISALLFAFSIELSQLYQADWINAIRHTRLGGLVLGFGFQWTDLVAYSVGIAFGATLDYLTRTRNKL